MGFSQTTRNALARVAAGATPYAAAKAEGLALTTVYNALKKLKLENKSLLDSEQMEPKTTTMSRAVATVNLSQEEMERCKIAAEKIGTSRYKFFQLAIVEKTETVLKAEI